MSPITNLSPIDQVTERFKTSPFIKKENLTYYGYKELMILVTESEWDIILAEINKLRKCKCGLKLSQGLCPMCDNDD